VSSGNPEKFPWGLNAPTLRQRLVFAAAIGVVASLGLLLKFAYRPSEPVDFDLIWLGARLLWQGKDPYQLIGPASSVHWNFPLLYPATSLVAALPLAIMPIRAAAVAFVFVGSALLGFGITQDGWHRLPIFASAAFLDTTLGAQWSSILVAGIFLPSVCVIACAKPQVGLGVLAAANSRRAWTTACIGSLALGGVAFVLLPSWFGEWLTIVRAADHMKAALLQPGGFLIAIVLLRWRRPESWALLVIASLPQTLMWYSFLILLSFPRTYREACVLSLTSSIGYLLYHFALDHLQPTQSTVRILWVIVICTTYLPCVIAILRRPNRTQPPNLWPGQTLTSRTELQGGGS